MPLVTPNFHMNGCAAEAVALYQKAFGAKVQELYRYSDANPQDYAPAEEERNLVYHGLISIGGQRMMISDSLAEFPPQGNTLSLVLTFDTKEEVEEAYSKLLEGSRIVTPIGSTTYSSCFVSLIDRFGVRWELMTEQTER